MNSGFAFLIEKEAMWAEMLIIPATTIIVLLETVAKREETKAIEMIQRLYEYYLTHFDKIPDEFLGIMERNGDSKEQIVCDYIAGMTDNYAVKMFQEIFIPESWKI